jgi:type IV pilus assembly protein PilA
VAGVSNKICATSTSVPADPTKVAGQKYQSAASEWDAGDKDTGWACLKFSMSEPQYYAYSYTADTGLTKFTAQAQGDLDGDATYSYFKMYGEVRDQTVVVGPTIDEEKPEE